TTSPGTRRRAREGTWVTTLTPARPAHNPLPALRTSLFPDPPPPSLEPPSPRRLDTEGCHTRRGDKYVTVIIDLPPVRDGTGPSRLLDVLEGRSKKAFKDWLAQRDQAWRDGIEVVAMDGFSGFKTATTEELPEAVTVMDPFHVIRLAGDA